VRGNHAAENGNQQPKSKNECTNEKGFVAAKQLQTFCADRFALCV
jgi:hypothetical protein